MDFEVELNEAIPQGFNYFQAFIESQLRINPNYLNQVFWITQGKQLTVLSYLIRAHQEDGNESGPNLSSHIKYVLSLMSDINLDEPLHLMVMQGKSALALSVLKSQLVFDLNKRDIRGNTLLNLVISSQNNELLCRVLEANPNIHALDNELLPTQAIHRAVLQDYVDGVRLLVQRGAVLTNPFGQLKDTPLILAARLGKVRALEALLESPAHELVLEAENHHFYGTTQVGHTAIEELCLRLGNEADKHKSLKGIAMLLCKGAEPPRNEAMRQLLGGYRIELLKEAQQYLANKPELVDDFVSRCHIKNSVLHHIVYDDNSWANSFRHFFGKPNEAAFLLEGLVVRKYPNVLTTEKNHNPLTKEHSLKLYAEFVNRYNKAYASQIFTNPWSSMRWKISEGQGDWESIERYSKEHPTSRTRIVVNDMKLMMVNAAVPNEEVLVNGVTL